MFLTVSDFVGKFELHKGMYSQSKLTEYIDRYEEVYLVQLFGKDLYDEFIGDLVNNVPVSPNFIKVFNPFIEQVDFNKLIISKGILDMLKGFIYWEYAKDLINQMTPFGNVAPMSENSTVVTPLYSMMYTRYNESIKTYRAIQTYMLYNTNAPIGALLEVDVTNVGDGYDGYLWYSDLTQGTGTGGQLEFTSWQINGVRTLTPASVGSGYTDDTVYPTFGIGGCTVKVQTTPSGVPNLIEVVDAGTGYSIGDLLTIDGGNNDQDFTVDSLGNGEIQSILVYEGGQNYTVGDTFTLSSNTHPNTGNLGEAVATKVSVGDFGKCKGVYLEYAYWL